LPPTLAQLLGPMTPPVTQSMASPQMFNPASGGLSSNMTQDSSFVPSYAEGGMVGTGGMPDMGGMQQGMPQGMGSMPQGGMPQGMSGMGGQAGLQPQGTPAKPMGAQQIEAQITQFMNQHPEQVAKIQQVVQAGLQAGEFTMEDINMMEQMATTALQNPEMYPYVRQFAIQRGFADEQSLSPQYDEGLVVAVLIAARAAKSMQTGQADPSMGQAVSPPQNFAMGGYVTPYSNAAEGGKVVGPGTGKSDSVPINVSQGEYVIPAHVVKMKGKEFFDSMLEKYKD
jgi:hypothetical protein